MKSIIVVAACLFAANAYAARVECTTKLTRGQTDKSPQVTLCGAVGENISNNGLKNRHQTKKCKNISVELFSVRSSDDKKFTRYCDSIGQHNCFVVRIRDKASRQGMTGLSSHMVFSSVEAMPVNFGLGASGVGHRRGASPGPGTLVRLDLNCRVRK